MTKLESKKKWSNKIKTRDNFRCQKCNATSDEVSIEVHHIEKEDENEHGVCLCKWCHLVADMGYFDFLKWMNVGNDGYESIFNFMKEASLSNPDLENEINKIGKNGLDKIMKALSLYIIDKTIMRWKKGKEYKKGLKNEAKTRRAKKRPKGKS